MLFRSLVPGRYLLAGTLQHPESKRNDQAGFLGQGDEAGRRHGLPAPRLPADQGLGPEQSAQMVHLRLEMQMKLACRQSLAQGCLQGHAGIDGRLHGGVEEADAVACVTNSDALNAVVGHVVQVEYGVKKVVVRNYDNRLRHIYDLFHLQVIRSSIWGAQRLEELISKTPARAIFSAGNGEVEIYEISVTAALVGKKIHEIASPGSCLIVSLTRDGRAVLPEEDFTLQCGDMLCISATVEGISKIQAMLSAG